MSRPGFPAPCPTVPASAPIFTCRPRPPANRSTPRLRGLSTPWRASSLSLTRSVRLPSKPVRAVRAASFRRAPDIYRLPSPRASAPWLRRMVAPKKKWSSSPLRKNGAARAARYQSGNPMPRTLSGFVIASEQIVLLHPRQLLRPRRQGLRKDFAACDTLPGSLWDPRGEGNRMRIGKRTSPSPRPIASRIASPRSNLFEVARLSEEHAARNANGGEHPGRLAPALRPLSAIQSHFTYRPLHVS